MKNLRCRSLLAAALLLLPVAASAQSICFWTPDQDLVPIRIYIDEEYIGDVTAAFAAQPELDTPGTLSVDTTPVRHSLTAVDKYGRVFKSWSGTLTPQPGKIYFERLHGRGFREVNRKDYAFVFLDWVPLFPLPRYYRYGRYIEDLYPLEDQGLLVGMAATAVGATAAMGVAASRNWNVADSRFPYFAVGLGTEYFGTLCEWRNTTQFKYRFGNKGGVSILGDVGIASFPRSWEESVVPTFSVGAGLDYGGLGFSLRYKPAVGMSWDTFLVARLEHDWWITDVFALDFHAGFGVGGYGAKGLMDYYDFPFGFGFLFRL
jgi:hypothetical protein